MREATVVLSLPRFVLSFAEENLPYRHGGEGIREGGRYFIRQERKISVKVVDSPQVSSVISCFAHSTFASHRRPTRPE